jgi:DNA-binding transcriptional regulator PaaX
MARTLNDQSIKLLRYVSQHPGAPIREMFPIFSRSQPYKDFYNNIYRLSSLGLINKEEKENQLCAWITDDGKRELKRLLPEKDGIWKLVIFDIPEKQKYVRVILRAKLKALHFKKWQNSIWITPYALDEEIENELKDLAKKFFVRLIKTTDINNTDDLKKLFTD